MKQRDGYDDNCLGKEWCNVERWRKGRRKGDIFDKGDSR